MLSIDIDTLRVLSEQSKIKIEEKVWIDELNQWVEFFSFKSSCLDCKSSRLCENLSSLREDVVGPGLTAPQVRELSTCFQDGFFVLPMKIVDHSARK